MRRISAKEVHERKIIELRLDSDALDLTSTEAIAGALRRVASFSCPCAGSTLVRGVVRPLRGLVDDLADFKDSVETVLDAMIAHGDLIEQARISEDSCYETELLLYAASPCFIMRQSGVVILIGISSEYPFSLPEYLEARIEYISHIRRMLPLPGEDLRTNLIQLCVTELSYSNWLKQPPAQSPAEYISKLNMLLDAAPQSLEIPGLSLLDPERPVRYYRGRWTEPSNQTGRFVGRRAQAYGADLWCFIEVNKGNPVKFIDLPIKNSSWRGCDEAWRLQAAIDFERGSPQIFKIHPGPSENIIFRFYSPVPMWARKRWDAVGESIEPSGSLFSYKFAKSELSEEVNFIKKFLWLDEAN